MADANVLIPRTLRDYIVYAAKAGAIQLHWSQAILDEMSRNLIAKFGFTPDDATELELRLTEYLPRALIEVRRRDTQVVAQVKMDAKDRHVVAVAVLLHDDPGTIAEVGWSVARGKPVVLYDPHARAENLMLTHLPDNVVRTLNDLVAAVYDHAARL